MNRTFLIAIVDDDEGVRQALSSLLRSEGYAVRLYDGAEAYLTDARASAVDCVLTDVQMAGMNGLQLQETIKAIDPKLPVIVMTAFPEAALRERALGSGAVCFLSKPFDADTLFDCLARAVEPRAGS